MPQKVIDRLGKSNIFEEAQALQVLMHRFVPLQAALTAAAFDGDSFPTTAKTLIDLSAVFGVPAGIRAVDVQVQCNDSGSAGGDCFVILSPTNVADTGKIFSPAGLANDEVARGSATVPCDANGDIYYQVLATGGAGTTLDIALEIWGYFI